ncbi:MAG: hypothetical protein K2N43_09370 [Lachnospiraceae bacterium]|nr:hypothetical protein [Lachnospiraceae bacterium]
MAALDWYSIKGDKWYGNIVQGTSSLSRSGAVTPISAEQGRDPDVWKR